MLYKIDHELVAISKTDRLDRPTRRLRQSHDNAYLKYHTVGLTSGRCRSSQELSETGTPCRLTKPAWTHLMLLKLQFVSNKPPWLLLSFNLFLTYPDARLPLMHSTYLSHCMIFDTTMEAVNRQKQVFWHVWVDWCIYREKVSHFRFVYRRYHLVSN
jgi:hypothetical protein